MVVPPGERDRDRLPLQYWPVIQVTIGLCRLNCMTALKPSIRPCSEQNVTTRGFHINFPTLCKKTHHEFSVTTLCSFTRPYFSNGRAVVMVVVRPSVCLSRMSLLWLNAARYGLCCYWSLIESHILAFKWHINRWSWMTLKRHNALCIRQYFPTFLLQRNPA